MAVVPLTVLGSLGLAALFAVLFYREQARGRPGSPEHDSLLPLEEETPRVRMEAAFARREDAARRGDESCGCRSGRQAPCPGGLKSQPHRHS